METQTEVSKDELCTWRVGSKAVPYEQLPVSQVAYMMTNKIQSRIVGARCVRPIRDVRVFPQVNPAYLHKQWVPKQSQVLRIDTCSAKGNHWITELTQTQIPSIGTTTSVPYAIPSWALQNAGWKAMGGLSAATPANFGVNLAEASETVGMIRAPFSSLLPVMKQVSRYVGTRTSSESNRQRRKHKRSFPHLWKALGRSIYAKMSIAAIESAAGAWLAVEFGFRPVIQTAVQAVEDLNTSLIKHKDRVFVSRGTVKGSETVRSASPVTRNITSVPYLVSSRFDVDTVYKWRVDCYIYYRYNLYLGEYIALSALGIAPGQVPGLFYAVLPLSFMVDWMWNVGGMINAFAPHPHVTTGTYGTSQSIKWTKRWTKNPNYGYGCTVCGSTSGSLDPSAVHLEGCSLSRGPTLPTQVAWAPIPRKPDLDWEKAISMAAVSVTRMFTVLRSLSSS